MKVDSVHNQESKPMEAIRFARWLLYAYSVVQI
ncbi:unnamed protein product [Echinostoma caproni]|uniref:Transposase n=1 Tax=Echinostoma caproni TaxID=27848 RepID=A0A183A303_9TREM|nr:unnamed protein product [Echinostoma caproni]